MGLSTPIQPVPPSRSGARTRCPCCPNTAAGRAKRVRAAKRRIERVRRAAGKEDSIVRLQRLREAACSELAGQRPTERSTLPPNTFILLGGQGPVDPDGVRSVEGRPGE